MAKMYLMCGLAAAGKTTFALDFAKKNNLEYIGIDRFYKEFYDKDKGAYNNADIAFRAWINFYEAIHKAEMEGKDVIVDTNAPTKVKRLQFIDWFPTFDEHNLIYIGIYDEERRRANNRNRARVIPEAEMERMLKEFEPPFIQTKDGKLHIEKGWTNIFVYENVDNHFYKWWGTKKMAV